MNVRDLFDNQYLAADDLRGKPWTLTIQSVTKAKLPSGKTGKSETRGIVRFDELEAKATKDKPAMALVLNRTNAKTIKALYGKDTSEWIGKRITIYPTTCSSFGKTVDCIRIEAEVPSGAAKATGKATKPSDDEADLPEPPEGHVSP